MKQHKVPKSYLKAWLDPNCPLGHEPYVWLISKDRTSVKKKAPHKILTSPEIYTIQYGNGRISQHVEISLGNLENRFVAIRNKILRFQDLDQNQLVEFAAFMVAMHARTDRLGGAVQRAFREVQEKASRLRGSTPDATTMALHGSQLGNQNVREAEMKFLAENARGQLVQSALESVVPAFLDMFLAFLVAPSGSFFVTSDNPLVMFDPTGYRRPPAYRGAGLAFKDVEVTMPVHPNICALVSHNPKYQGYLLLPEHGVSKINVKTIWNSTEFFISPSPAIDERWFDRGTPPADAWELRHPIDDDRSDE